jgi:Flp pilus assembly protein TadD
MLKTRRLHHATRVLALVVVALSASPSLAADSGSGGKSSSDTPSQTEVLSSSLADVRVAIKAENWGKAIKLLNGLISDGTSNADVYNLLGFSLRKSGDMDNALDYYLKALKLNPRHKGAHEYLGELYVETGNLTKAKEHLQILADLCGNTTCEEYEDLEKAIASRT